MSQLKFNILGKNPVLSDWNGMPITLQQFESASMPQTTNGAMILGWMNMASQNNNGTLTVTSGGRNPLSLPAPALTNQFGILINDWEADSLGVTNTSPQKATPIVVEAFGPGIPGQVTSDLPIGTRVFLAPSQSAQGATPTSFFQLVFSVPNNERTTFAFIGGPPVNNCLNGYAVILNYSENTGPTGTTPPDGYYATTTANSWTFESNWNGAIVYVVNMSPTTSSGANLTLIKL